MSEGLVAPSPFSPFMTLTPKCQPRDIFDISKKENALSSFIKTKMQPSGNVFSTQACSSCEDEVILNSVSQLLHFTKIATSRTFLIQFAWRKRAQRLNKYAVVAY